jgi:UDP-GlcNAc:undecaprenyl-phosphate/decaprenyl-phosphate GlcNAc-1-phosphate transferase
LAVVIVAFALSVAWCLLAIVIGPRIGFVDRPHLDDLKVHDNPAVPLGGVGIYVAVVAATLLRDEADMVQLTAFTLVLVLGLIDERVGLSPAVRLLVETVVAAIVVVGWELPGEHGMVHALGAGILIVVAINAVNLFDGLDGLAGTTGLVTAVGLATAAWLMDLPSTVPVALAAGLVGFLLFNWQPARVFLGDGGSYLLGLVIAMEVVRLSDGPADLLANSMVLGVFVIDLAITMLRRALHGRPLFQGDRSHVYDQLRDRGWALPRVVLTAALVQAAIVSAVVLAWSSAAALVVGAVMLSAVTGLLVAGGFLRVDHAPGA